MTITNIRDTYNYDMLENIFKTILHGINVSQSSIYHMISTGKAHIRSRKRREHNIFYINIRYLDITILAPSCGYDGYRIRFTYLDPIMSSISSKNTRLY